MIRMKDWKVFCPESDRILGHVGDNLLRRLEIETDTGPEWSVVLDLEKGSGKNVVAMSQTGNHLWVDLTDEMLGKNGTYTAQLRGTNGEKVAHSNLFTLMINRSINAIDSFPPLKPSEIAQLEAEMHRLKTEAATAADIAQNAAERTKEARDAIVLDEQRLSQAVRGAEESASQAQQSVRSIENMEVRADTLGAGSAATVRKEVVDGVVRLIYGIPEGKQGATGPAGAEGKQGPPGPQGINGVAVAADGQYAFNVNEDGNLILSYTGDTAPNLSINGDGCLILII